MHSTGKSDPNIFAGGHYDDLKTGGKSWGTGTANTGAITGISSKADVFDHPDTDTTTGRFIFPTEKARQIGLAFVGVGADGAEFDAFVWGWQRVNVPGPLSSTNATACPPKWVAVPLLNLSVVLGARTVADNQADPLALQNSGFSFRYADTITIDNDYTFGASADVVGDAVDGWSLLLFDPCGVDLIEEEISNNAAGTDTTRALPFYKRA